MKKNQTRNQKKIKSIFFRQVCDFQSYLASSIGEKSSFILTLFGCGANNGFIRTKRFEFWKQCNENGDLEKKIHMYSQKNIW